jgi:hypothetical protein
VIGPAGSFLYVVVSSPPERFRLKTRLVFLAIIFGSLLGATPLCPLSGPEEASAIPLTDILNAGTCQVGPAVLQISDVQNTYGDSVASMSAALISLADYDSFTGVGFRIWNDWTGNGSVSLEYSISVPDATTEGGVGWDLTAFSFVPGYVGVGDHPSPELLTTTLSYSAPTFGSGTVTSSIRADDPMDASNATLQDFPGGETLIGTITSTFSNYTGNDPGPSLEQLGFSFGLIPPPPPILPPVPEPNTALLLCGTLVIAYAGRRFALQRSR